MGIEEGSNLCGVRFSKNIKGSFYQAISFEP